MSLLLIYSCIGTISTTSVLGCVYIHITLLSSFLCARHWSKNCINYCLCSPQISELYPYCIWGKWGAGGKTEVTEESIQKVLNNISDVSTCIIEQEKLSDSTTAAQKDQLASGAACSACWPSISVISLAQPFLWVSFLSGLTSVKVTRGLPSSARATGVLIYVWGGRITFTTLPQQEWKIPCHNISYKRRRKNFACSLSVIKKTSISLKPEKGILWKS